MSNTVGDGLYGKTETKFKSKNFENNNQLIHSLLDVSLMPSTDSTPLPLWTSINRTPLTNILKRKCSLEAGPSYSDVAAKQIFDRIKELIESRHLGKQKTCEIEIEQKRPTLNLLTRAIFDQEQSCTFLKITIKLEIVVQRMRNWVYKNIVYPLISEIEFIDKEFHKAGIHHLGPKFSNPSNNFMLITTGTLQDNPKSLNELINKYPGEPLVARRVYLEKYLGGIGTSRSYGISRLVKLAQNEFLATYDSTQDSNIIMSLFLTFMNEHWIPDTNKLNGVSSKFSELAFVPLQQSSDSSPLAIQIQEYQPNLYQVVLHEHILRPFEFVK